MALQVNDVIDGKYRIVRLLGEGGMGAVYEGENTRIHRRVAIKVLHSGVAQSKDAVERFEREAQAAGRIGSEHIVEVLDLGNLPSGDRYMVMEFLDGQSLADRIEKRGRLDTRAAAEVALQLLEGLKAAHEAGIVHRDLKPDNVFLLSSRAGRRDFVKIVDFGISKFSAVGGDFSMTRTGAVMGTPYYMAPEQAKGARTLDHRADLYSAGVILYESTTGHVPFDADTFNELLFKIVLEEPKPVRDRVPEIDERFSAIVLRAMAKDPAQRYPSAAEFQADLADYLGLAPNSIGAPYRSALSSQVDGAPGAEHVLPAKKGGPSNTQGSWANTQAESPPEAARGVTKLAVAAGAGAVAIAAVAGFILLGGQPSAEPPSVGAASPAGEAPKKEVALQPEAAKAAAPGSPASVNSPPVNADHPPPTSPKVESPVAPAPSVGPSPAASGAPSPRTAPAATPAPSPAKPAERTPADSSVKKPAGRRIRTTL